MKKLVLSCLVLSCLSLGAFTCETGIYRHTDGSEIVMEKGQGIFYNLVSKQHNYSVIGQCVNGVFQGTHSQTGQALYFKKIGNGGYEYGVANSQQGSTPSIWFKTQSMNNSFPNFQPVQQNKPSVVNNFTLHNIYKDILERKPDPQGLQTWNNALNSGTSLASVRKMIAESPEAQNKLNSLYEKFLCRGIDPVGSATWTKNLANGWSLQRVANEGIKGSPEYRNRNGQPCN
jgi:Domain of unknown function (DUF4214)